MSRTMPKRRFYTVSLIGSLAMMWSFILTLAFGLWAFTAFIGGAVWATCLHDAARYDR